jgi:hypothetical protein
MERAEEPRFGQHEALRSNAPQGGFCHLKSKLLPELFVEFIK